MRLKTGLAAAVVTAVALLWGCSTSPVVVPDTSIELPDAGKLLAADQLGHFRRDVAFESVRSSFSYKRDGSFEELEYVEGPASEPPVLSGGRRGTYHYEPSRLRLTINVYTQVDPVTRKWVRTGDLVLETVSTQLYIGATGEAEAYVKDGTGWANIRIFKHTDFEDETRSVARVTRRVLALGQGIGGYRWTETESTSVATGEPWTSSVSELTANTRFPEDAATLVPGEKVTIELSSLSSWRQVYDAAAGRLGDPVVSAPPTNANSELSVVSMGGFLVVLGQAGAP